MSSETADRLSHEAMDAFFVTRSLEHLRGTFCVQIDDESWECATDGFAAVAVLRSGPVRETMDEEMRSRVVSGIRGFLRRAASEPLRPVALAKVKAFIAGFGPLYVERYEKTCPACDGLGSRNCDVCDHENTCRTCRGEGVVAAERVPENRSYEVSHKGPQVEFLGTRFCPQLVEHMLRQFDDGIVCVSVPEQAAVDAYRAHPGPLVFRGDGWRVFVMPQISNREHPAATFIEEER